MCSKDPRNSWNNSVHDVQKFVSTTTSSFSSFATVPLIPLIGKISTRSRNCYCVYYFYFEFCFIYHRAVFQRNSCRFLEAAAVQKENCSRFRTDILGLFALLYYRISEGILFTWMKSYFFVIFIHSLNEGFHFHFRKVLSNVFL